MTTAKEGDQSSRPVVAAVGASAGGLEAYRRFLRSLSAEPARESLALVLIQHLDPDHDSLMAELLAPHSALPLAEVEGPVDLLAGHAYAIPPGRYLSLENGRLVPIEPTRRRGLRLPLDHFLEQLAKSYGNRSCAVVLTGTGSDGSSGVRAIKEAGGLVMVQSPETAEHSGMPESVIETGLADLVLPIEEMPAALLQWVHHPYVTDGGASGAGEETPSLEDDLLGEVLHLVHRRTGLDFRSYRRGTLSRRIGRRMSLHGLCELDEYLELLEGDETEVELLLKDLVISVTDFFRDPEAWRELESKVLPDLVADTEGPLRLWTPGCATGEEAYTLAMIASDAAARSGREVQVFATDIDREAIEVGRAGIYPTSVVAAVPPQRRERYFQAIDGDRWQVQQVLRDRVAFARQNLLEDPPFSRLDLITCRNLMIYLEEPVQEQLRELFHFALRPRGVLMLGTAEGIGGQSELFDTVSKKWRIFRRRAGRPRQLRVPRGRHVELRARRDEPRDPDEADVARRLLMEASSPPAVVVDSSYRVVYLHGDVSPYLSLPTGEPRMVLSDLLRPSLRSRVRAGLFRAFNDGEPLELRTPRSDLEEGETPVRVRVVPHEVTERGPLAVVTFEADPESTAEPSSPSNAEDLSVVAELERELESTRDELRSTVEELEASNEELKASNEEVLSINEELQSANEELETSSEELRSLNQELSTVNAELKTKLHELGEAHDDLSNLLSSTRLAVVFLDRDLAVRRFTSAANRLLTLSRSDLGRPLAEVPRSFDDPHLEEDAARVLADLSPVEREVRDEEDRWYQRRLLPYRTRNDRIAGVVLVLSEVTGLKRALEGLAARERQQATLKELGMRALRGVELDQLLDDAVDVTARVLGVELCKVLELTEEGLFLRAGVGWDEGLVGSSTVPSDLGSQGGFTLHSAGPVVVEDLASEERFSGPALLTDHGVVSGMSVPIGGEAGPWGVLGVHTRSRRRFDRYEVDFLQNIANLMAGAIGRHAADESLRASERRERENAVELATLMASVPAAVWISKDRNASTVTGNPAALELMELGKEAPGPYTSREIRDRGLRFFIDGQEMAHEDYPLRRASRGETVEGVELEIRWPQGRSTWILGNTAPLLDDNGEPRGGVAAFLDVTSEVEARQALESALDRLREEDRRKDQFLAMLGHELRNPVASVDSAVRLMEERGGEAFPSLRSRLRENLRHLRRLLDDLLDVSRITRGKIDLHREPTDLSRVVERAVEGEADGIERRSQELSVRLPPDEVWVDGDPTRLEQVVLNLVGNASRYTPEGGQIRVRLDAAVEGEHRLLVEDSGDGIPAEMLEEIFEPFVQVGRDGTARGGLGLGLTLVRQLVELHGGTIRAESGGSGRGSRFVVRLPMGEAPEPGEAAEPDARPRPQPGLEVLIVDDNVDAATGLADLLELHGCDVRVATGPEAARQAFEAARPEVLLLDLDLPGKSGYELLEELRAADLVGDCEVVVITGFGHEEARQRSRDAGIDHHLIKPVDLDELLALLARR